MNEKDTKKHKRTKELFHKEIKKIKIPPIFMLSETITYLNSRIDTKNVQDFYEIIIDTVQIYHPNPLEVDEK